MSLTVPMRAVNITEVMIKLQIKLPQALISRGFTRRTVFHAPAFQQKGINRLMDIYQIPLITQLKNASFRELVDLR